MLSVVVPGRQNSVKLVKPVSGVWEVAVVKDTGAPVLLVVDTFVVVVLVVVVEMEV